MNPEAANFIQWAVNILMAVIITLGGFAVKRMWWEIDRTRQHVHDLNNKLSTFALGLAERSATKNDLTEFRQEHRLEREVLQERLGRLESMLQDVQRELRSWVKEWTERK
jgi:chromosome segregation ATPase